MGAVPLVGSNQQIPATQTAGHIFAFTRAEAMTANPAGRITIRVRPSSGTCTFPGTTLILATSTSSLRSSTSLSFCLTTSTGSASSDADGGARDADYILRQDFPVFARYVTPQDCVPRWELLAHGDVTIVVGGVRVAPGDWIVGDRDGLVIVPGERVDEILSEAEAKVATENEIRESVRHGTLPLDAYERYGTF